MQYASLGAQLVGTASQTIAGVRASRAEAKSLKNEAQSELLAGEYNASLVRNRAAYQAGRSRSVGAASGVDISSGTPLDVMLESAKQAELDALAERYQANVKAQALKTKGKIAQGQILPQIGTGLVRGSTYLSDWMNKYYS